MTGKLVNHISNNKVSVAMNSTKEKEYNPKTKAEEEKVSCDDHIT